LGTAVRQSTDKRVVRTKKAIKNALIGLIEFKELSDITISELTVAANVNRRTFYTHYHNITDILDEIESELVAELTSILADFDYNNYKQSVYKTFLGFYELMTGEFEYYFKRMHMDTRGILTSRLKNAVKTSIFPALPSRRTTGDILTASYAAGGFIAAFTEWYYSEDRIPPEQAAEIVSSIAQGSMNAVRR